MQLIRYRAEYQEPMLALHRSAIEGFTLGMSQQQDEADLMVIEEVYLRTGGEFLLGFVGERLMAMGGFKRLSDTCNGQARSSAKNQPGSEGPCNQP